MENLGCSQPSATPVKCANGCGFFGSPENANMCSKCFRSIYKKRKESEEVTERETKQPKLEVPVAVELKEAETLSEKTEVSLPAEQSESAEESQKKVDAAGKCGKCSKRLGLTAIRCRCNLKFCAKHRYSDQHDCSFDYKTHGRKELEEKNPQVVGTKLQPL